MTAAAAAETVRQNLLNTIHSRSRLLSELSEQTGIDAKRLQGIIDGTTEIKCSEIPKFCSALAIRANDLFKGV